MEAEIQGKFAYLCGVCGELEDAAGPARKCEGCNVQLCDECYEDWSGEVLCRPCAHQEFRALKQNGDIFK